MGPRVCLLSGGVGGAKLALGLYSVLEPASLTIIANTGDDIDIFGLRVCPDMDILLYTLIGQVDEGKGWGIGGDTFRTLTRIRELGGTAWFNLGDVDLGMHLYRTERLQAGEGLAQITGDIAATQGLECTLLPMCESKVTTRVETDEGVLHLQEYLVKRLAAPTVLSIDFEGADLAAPAPGVADAIENADLIVIAPSNPLISIAPILAVPGMREMLRASPARKIGVSPVVGGASLKGPTDRMLSDLGHAVTPGAVARLYDGLLDDYFIDEGDASHREEIESLGLVCHLAATVMRNRTAKEHLARRIVALGRVS